MLGLASVASAATNVAFMASLDPEAFAVRREIADSLRKLTALVVAGDLPLTELELAASDLQQTTSRLLQNAGPERIQRLGPDMERYREVFPMSPWVGTINPIAPPMRVRFEDGEVRGTVRLGYPYEGPPGLVHGGIIAGLFDEILGAANLAKGLRAMTATLTIRYRKPTPLGEELDLRARVVEQSGRRLKTTAKMCFGREVTAEAEGIFVAFDEHRFLELMKAQDGKSFSH